MAVTMMRDPAVARPVALRGTPAASDVRGLLAVREPCPCTTSQEDRDEQDDRLIPDGTKIAFASNRDGNFETYAMNADAPA
jgi:hypothetical protein